MNIESSVKTEEVSSQRAKKNQDNLLGFIEEKSNWFKERHVPDYEDTIFKYIENIGVRNFVELCKICVKYRDELEFIMSYTRRFKKASIEIKESDIEEVMRALTVMSVTKT